MTRGRPPARSSPPTSNARTAALRLLGRREFTAAEITARLIDRGYPADEVEAAVSRLVSERLLDDRRVAAAFVRTASSLKGRGRVRIQRDLELRGISRAIVREVLAELSSDDDVRAIQRFLEKRRVSSRPGPDERRRLFQQLLRRGFQSDAIQRALKMDIE